MMGRGLSNMMGSSYVRLSEVKKPIHTIETFQRSEHFTFTGRRVPMNKENENAIIKYRLRRIERAAIKARMKSLNWLLDKNVVVKDPNFFNKCGTIPEALG